MDNFEMYLLLYKYIYIDMAKKKSKYFIMYKHTKFENMNAYAKISSIFIFMNHIV